MKALYTFTFLSFILSFTLTSQTFNIGPTSGSFGVGSTYGFDTYTNNMAYTWHIDLQNNAQFVQISIDYHIEGNVWDFITVFSCDDNFMNLEEIVTINSNQPDNTTIESNVKNGKMVLKFQSDASVNEDNVYKGFSAQVNGVTENTLAPILWNGYNHTFSTEKNPNALILTTDGSIGVGAEPFGVLFRAYREENPNFIIHSDESGFEVGVSTIVGGYSPYANVGDVILRSQSSLSESMHLFLNSTENDGLSKISFGDASRNYPTMSVFNNGKVTIGTSDFDEDAILTIDGDAKLFGDLDIGDENSSANLTVYGILNAREVLITPLTADFVFDEDYQLNSLDSVETYIQDNKHLPGVPSAKHMTENGIGVAEMNQLLLQKVEELTLYMIELKKQNESQQVEIESLKNQVQ